MHTGYRPVGECALSGDRRDRRQVSGPRGDRPAELHQDLRPWRRRRRVPRAQVSTVRRSVRRATAAVLRFEPGTRRKSCDGTSCGLSWKIDSPPSTRVEVAKMHRESYEAARRLQKAHARCSRSTPSGRSTANCTATASSAGAACWRGGWSRRACRSSKSARAATTRTPTTSPGTKAWCRRWNMPGPGLLTDLKERGLLDKTLIVWTGEIGRTPSINNRAGRDHYVRCWTTALAGCGIKGGQVYGASRRGRRRSEGQPGHAKATSSPRFTRPCRSIRRSRTTPACGRFRWRRSGRRW